MSSLNKKRREAVERIKEQESIQALWSKVRAFFGPVVAALGASVIGTYYPLGAGLVGLGLFITYLEVVFEPWIVRHTSLRVHCLLMAASLVPLGWFMVSVLSKSAPLSFDSYAIRTDEFSSDGEIARIQWDSHFTDLRVSITNPSEDDYHDVDLVIQPDRWNYKANIFDENTGCLLTPIGGKTVLIVPSAKGGATRITAHRVGEGFQAEDNSGDVFEPFIEEGGYRLRCAKFPAHFTVQIVFALATGDQKLMSHSMPSQLKPGEWGFDVSEIKPISKFELLEPRPTTSQVEIRGRYGSGFKSFSITHEVFVADGK